MKTRLLWVAAVLSIITALWVDAKPPEIVYHEFWKLVDGVLTTDRSVGMFTSRVEKTSDAVLTADECKNTIITNQGAAGEIDLILPAISAGTKITFVVEEAQVIEVGPPTGETFDLDGTTLDANDCIDSPAVVGSKMVCTRHQIADGTWRWSCDTVRGPWVDTGASD
jgi:hypothetical protein